MKRSIVILIFIFFLALFFFKSCKPQEKLYFIPKAKLYMKLYKGTMSDTTYIYFSRNLKGPFSKEYDYLKVIDKVGTNLIVNIDENNKLIIPSHDYGIESIHQKEFTITRSNDEFTDTLFYKPQIRTEPRILKDPFWEISKSEYMESVYIKGPGDGYFTEISEIIQ